MSRAQNEIHSFMLLCFIKQFSHFYYGRIKWLHEWFNSNQTLGLVNLGVVILRVSNLRMIRFASLTSNHLFLGVLPQYLAFQLSWVSTKCPEFTGNFLFSLRWCKALMRWLAFIATVFYSVKLHRFGFAYFKQSFWGKFWQLN